MVHVSCVYHCVPLGVPQSHWHYVIEKQQESKTEQKYGSESNKITKRSAFLDKRLVSKQILNSKCNLVLSR